MVNYPALGPSGHSATWKSADGAHESTVTLQWENEGWTANGTLGADNAQFVLRMSASWMVQQFLLNLCKELLMLKVQQLLLML